MPGETLPPRYALKLLRVGPDRVHTLREIRAARPDLSLGAAKTLLDDAPSILKGDLLKADVDRLRWRFEDLAEVEVVNFDGTPLVDGCYNSRWYGPSTGMIDG